MGKEQFDTLTFKRAADKIVSNMQELSAAIERDPDPWLQTVRAILLMHGLPAILVFQFDRMSRLDVEGAQIDPFTRLTLTMISAAQGIAADEMVENYHAARVECRQLWRDTQGGETPTSH